MAMMWQRIGRTVEGNGATTTIYRSLHDHRFTIESRKRPIAHASGSGFWLHTSYFVLFDGNDVKERYSLKDAKKWADDMAEKMKEEAAK